MFEKTTQERVTAEVAVWAIPRTEHEISTSEDGCPFYYELRLTDAWQDGAIKLHTSEVAVHLPAGIPLLERAIETLKEAIREEERESTRRINRMQARIDSLALIEYHPEAHNDATAEA